MRSGRNRSIEGVQEMTSFNDGIEAAVTTDQARRFLECAVRNWSRVSFDRDGLEDFRTELERFRQKVLADALKRPEPSEDMIERLSAWWRSWDTGLSSEAIALFLGMGVKSGHTPSDSADLGRCLRLLGKVPEWQARFSEMRNAGGAWPFIVDRWDELELHYKTDNCDAVYALLNEAHSEHRAALAAAGGE